MNIRSRKELGALAVANLRTRGIHRVGGVIGLCLNVNRYGGRSWVLRYEVNGRRRDMGLGAYPSVTLAAAREAARAARAKLAQGIDPINAVRSARSLLHAEQAAAITFGHGAVKYIEAYEPGWRNPKHAQQWRNTIESYANPVIGKILLKDIGLPHVLSVLEPIWHTKTETANRLRGRIEAILDWAIARGYRTNSNPARWKGLLEKLLPAPNKIAKKAHHRAIPYVEMPSVMAQLMAVEGMGASALIFAVLTACRSGEVRLAQWSEFDLQERLWTIPADRMKAGKEHRVPLSDAAMVIINKQKAISFCEYVFPSPNRSKSEDSKGAPLSDMTLTAVLRRMGIDAVPHGFRSTFRDWAAEQTEYSNEVAEMALAHAVSNKVEAAYRRGDLFAKRRGLMRDWATYCSTSSNETTVMEVEPIEST
jgi:integrase